MPRKTNQHPANYERGSRVGYTWSAKFVIEPPQTFDEIVKGKLARLVMDLADTKSPISGAVLGSGELADRATLVLGIHPNNDLGNPSIEKCENAARTITQECGWQRIDESPAEMRVILGRRVGYDKNARTSPMEEVRALAVAHGCGELALAEGDLFSLRYMPGGNLREYHEPCAVIEGTPSDLGGVMHVARDLGQERFVAEITGTETQTYIQSTP